MDLANDYLFSGFPKSYWIWRASYISIISGHKLALNALTKLGWASGARTSIVFLVSCSYSGKMKTVNNMFAPTPNEGFMPNYRDFTIRHRDQKMVNGELYQIIRNCRFYCTSIPRDIHKIGDTAVNVKHTTVASISLSYIPMVLSTSSIINK